MKNFDTEKDEASNYIQAFMKAKGEQREESWTFTERQLITSLNGLFIAGTETTASTLRWAILYLTLNPKIQDEIFDEIRRETRG